jgi:Secretion system C-terminal sorting domain
MNRILNTIVAATVLLAASVPSIQAGGVLENPDGFRFTQNKGQIVKTNGRVASDVLFKAQTAGAEIYLTDKGMSFVLVSMDWQEEPFHDMEGEMAEKMRMKDAQLRLERIDLNLNNINPDNEIVTGAALPSYDNFYYAHCPEGITHVPSFSDITYKNVYPHIDWHITTRSGILKTEFIVHPGGEPSQISLGVSGAQAYALMPDGSLELTGLTGHVTDAAPTADQAGQAVDVRFQQHGDAIHFRVGDYDNTRDLVLDPYTRVYSTFFGSTAGEWYLGHVTTTDATGRVYLAGHSPGTAFPTTAGMFQTVNAGSNDGFIAQFDNNGARQWCTFYGGSSSEGGIAFKAGLCTDPSNNIWFATVTSSTNFPVTAGCFQAALSAGPDAALVKLNSAGTRLYATYFGGNGDESPGISRWGANSAPAIASDASGNIFMTGLSSSTNLATTTGCFQTANAGGLDAYLVKWSNVGARLYCSYYGGSSNEESAAVGIAVDVAGNAWMTGCTASGNFPTTAGAFQTVFGGTFDQYLIKWNNACVRQYATYYGGSGDEGILCDVDVTSSGDVWLGVFVESTNFPVTAGANQPNNAGGWDFGVVRFNNAGTRLYASYYGSGDQEEPWDISVDKISGNVCLTGAAWGTAFPTMGPPFQSVSAGSQEGAIVVLGPTGVPTYVTYYGGPGHDEAFSSAFDVNQNLWVSGMAAGAGFPFTAGAFQTTPPGGTDPYLAKFTPPIILDQGQIQLMIDHVDGDKVGLAWSYDHDADVQRYSLERDLGGHWESITTLKPNGSGTYGYEDVVPMQGMVQYRIQLQMQDGGIAYSELARTNIAMTSDKLLSAWPNPVKAGDDLHLQYQMIAAGALTVEIADLTGKVVAHADFALMSGRSRIEMPTGNLAAGNYLLQIHSSKARETFKFVIE